MSNLMRVKYQKLCLIIQDKHCHSKILIQSKNGNSKRTSHHFLWNLKLATPHAKIKRPASIEKRRFISQKRIKLEQIEAFN